MVPLDQTGDFLDECPPALRDAVDRISRDRHAAAGEVLLRAGSLCAQLYQLRAGKVEYRAAQQHGSGVAATMGKGAWIGLPEVFSGLPATADVVAITPVELRAIPKAEFEALLARHPALARRLLQLLSVSLSSVYHQARDRHALPLRERLLRALHRLALSHGKTLRQQPGIVIEMAQDELSRRLDASRQTLNRQLKQLEREGLVRVNYGSITVLGLQRLAEGQVSPMPPPAACTAAETWPGAS